MKTLSFILFLVAVFTCLSGAPLRNYPGELTQPDGSVHTYYMTGDEYYHRAHDARGYTIVQDPGSGWYVYAEQSGSELVPSRHVYPVANPEALGLAPNLTIDKAIIEQRIKRFRGDTMDQYGRSPTIGTVNNITIFVRFSDQAEYTDPLSTYDSMYNSSTGVSMKGYFLEDSGSQLTVDTSFYPSAVGGIVRSYQDPHPQAYYIDNYGGTNPIGYNTWDEGYYRLHTMLTNAVVQISPTVSPSLNIDADGDGSIDNISFVCMGGPTAWYEALWPHNWVLDYYHNNPSFPMYNVPLVYINGAMADEYDFQLRDVIDTALICHEFSHTLGFPDLYHYSFDGIDPCGFWDLMDTCQGTPQHHLTYQKWKYGNWFTTVPTLPVSGVCDLNAVATNPFACYMYQMPTGEQIWMEYRLQTGNYETRVPGSGLIIYRVDQNQYPWGNAGGPPDEIYVYRPFVSMGWPNGNINSAHYAWEQAHTAINPFTDPAPFSYSNPGFVAPLNIYSVGTNQGPSISFETGTQIPVIWTGAVNFDWFNGANWSTGSVPTASDLVIVAQGASICQIPPPAVPGGAVCNDLRVEHQLNLMLGSILNVGGNLDSIGRIFTDANALQVAGNLNIHSWYAGSWLHCVNNPPSQIRIGGNCTFENGANILLTTGQLVFIGGSTSQFLNDAMGSVLFDLVVSKTGGTLNYMSTIPMPSNIIGSLSVTAGATLNLNSLHDLFIDGNINVDPAGQLYAQQGMVILTGLSGIQNINIANPQSYLNDVKIDNPSGSYIGLANNLSVRGMLSINQGSLTANIHTIFLHGHWSNMVGLGGFQKGTSTVCFCGSADQSIIVGGAAMMEDFFTLELAKPSGFLNINTPMLSVNCDFFDYSNGTLRITEGVFNANGLTDNCVAGNFICDAPAALNLTNITGPVDLCANLMIGGGVVNVFGGAGNSQWPPPITFQGVNPGIAMNSGNLTFHNVGVIVGNPSQPFVEGISGGNIQVNGDFEIQRPDFHPSGGVIEVMGANPANIGSVPGGAYYDLALSATNVQTSLDLQVNGFLHTMPGVAVNVNHNVVVNGVFMLDGTVNVLSPVNIALNGPLVFPTGGILDLWFGNLTASTQSPMTPVDGTILIEGGTFDARDHDLVINPSGSIAFGTHGGGGGGRLICAGLKALTGGTFVPTIGTLELGSTQTGTSHILELDNGNQCFDLLLNTPSTVVLGCDLHVEQDLLLQQGVLDASTNNYQIWVKRDWLDTTATDPFLERMGTVHFQGASPSTLNSGAITSTFHNLSVEKHASIPLNLLSPIQVNGTLTVQVGCNALLSHNLGVNGMTHLEGQLHFVNPVTASLNGGLNCEPGSQMLINNGTCNLSGTGNVLLQGTITILGGSFEARNWIVDFSPTGSIVFGGGGSGGHVVCASLFANHSGNFAPSTGTLELGSTGAVGRSISLSAGNHAHHLVINSTGAVTTQSTVLCNGDLDVLAGKVLNLAYNTTINGDLDLYGTCNLTNPITLQLNGAVDIRNGSLLNIQNGICALQLATTPASFAVNGGISIAGGTLQARNHELYFNPTASLVMGGGGGGGAVICGSFYAPYAGNFQPTGGTIELGSTLTAARLLNVTSPNYLYDLKIDSAGPVTTQAALHCDNDCDVLAGRVLNLAYNATVDGDLDLNGTINLTNPITFTLHGHPTFATGSALNVNTGTFICDELPSRDTILLEGALALTSGDFELENHVLQIEASGLITQSGGILKLDGLTTNYDGRYQPTGGTLELTANLFEALRPLSLPGTNHTCHLVINSNAMVRLGADLLVKGDLTLQSGLFDVSTQNWDIALEGSFANPAGLDLYNNFWEREATVSFVGAGHACISYLGDREEFYNLEINKTNATDTVTLQGSIVVKNGGGCDVLHGTLSLNGYELENAGDTDIHDGGTLLLDPGSTLATGHNHMLNVYSGGTLITRGTGRARSKAKNKGDEDEWKAKAHSGSNLKSHHTDYEGMKEEGLLIEEYAIVDPDSTFEACSFSAGAPGCTYLTIDNHQDLMLNNVSFPDSLNAQYNIAKRTDYGSVTLDNASGPFAGAAHENDPHGRVTWLGFHPNLAITSFIVSDPDPVHPETIDYTVNIHNSEPTPVVGSFTVHLFKHSAAPPEFSDLGDLSHTFNGGLAGWGSCSHTFSGIAYADPTTWYSYALLDPEGAIIESDETDNRSSALTVVWGGILPNLLITHFDVTATSPTVGDTISFNVQIANASDFDIDQDFGLKLRIQSLTDPDAWYEHTVTGLAAHGTCNHVFSGITSSDPDTWTATLIVDQDNDIAESNETDNTALLPTQVNWQALPVLSGLTITKTGANTARLSWSYPVWVSRYRIYCDDDPYGSYSTDLGWTIDSFFDVSLNTEKRFYRVVAERDIP